jgi:hypothetical protein
MANLPIVPVSRVTRKITSKIARKIARKTRAPPLDVYDVYYELAGGRR